MESVLLTELSSHLDLLRHKSVVFLTHGRLYYALLRSAKSFRLVQRLKLLKMTVYT